MNSIYHKVAAFLFGALLGALVPIRCSHKAAEHSRPSEVRHRRVDTVLIPVSVPTIQTDVRIIRRTLRVPYADSVAVLALMAERETLQDSLRKRGATVVWSGDTVVSPHNDTIRVDCDEINRRATVAVRYAPRHVAVERITDSTVVTVTRMPRTSMTVGLGGVIGLDGTLRPGAFVGLGFNLFPLTQ